MQKINNKDKGKKTPLWRAASYGHEVVLKLLHAPAHLSRRENPPTTAHWGVANGCGSIRLVPLPSALNLTLVLDSPVALLSIQALYKRAHEMVYARGAPAVECAPSVGGVLEASAPPAVPLGPPRARWWKAPPRGFSFF